MKIICRHQIISGAMARNSGDKKVIDEKFTRECADVYCIAFEQARKRCKNDVLALQAAQTVLSIHAGVYGKLDERRIKAEKEEAERRAEEKILKSMQKQYQELQEENREKDKESKGKA